MSTMPGLAARLMPPQAAMTVPTLWQELNDESILMPKPVAALPPKGWRHVLTQLDPKESSDQTAEGSDGAGSATYQLTFFGGIFHFKERFEKFREPGTLLPTSNPDKRDYVRYVDSSLAHAVVEQRALAVLNSVLLGLPVFFVNGVWSDDPMALWLLQ